MLTRGSRCTTPKFNACSTWAQPNEIDLMSALIAENSTIFTSNPLCVFTRECIFSIANKQR